MKIVDCSILSIIFIKSPVLDIDRIFDSVSDIELIVVLDVELNFIIFSVLSNRRGRDREITIYCLLAPISQGHPGKVDLSR